MSRYAIGASFLLVILAVCAALPAAESRFAETGSRSDYVHWIDLYDANHRRIDPTDPNAAPYSPSRTCGRCHDYEAMSRGHHFNAMLESAVPGRAGEPWIWTDTRTGTQIPLSYRRWPGTYDPRDLGISNWDFVLKFARHLPGGGPGDPSVPSGQSAKSAPSGEAAEGESQEPAKGAPSGEAQPADQSVDGTRSKETRLRDQALAEAGRWRLSGRLDIDCMICHNNDNKYSMEIWSKQIEDQNFAWAATAASGVGFVEGKVSSLPDDFEPAKADEKARHKLPTTTYAANRINAEKKVFFDVVRRPHDNTCYYCHTIRPVGEDAVPEWNRDEDVHLKAGLTCADCHRNDLEHHTVRGYEGEAHPTGQSMASLSCRGCHLEGKDSGRFGAPLARHAGLPPLHFDRLSCTACHSGPMPSGQASQVLTAMAHGLGLTSHHYSADLVPGVVEPVLKQVGRMLYPHRMTWPAFWGSLHGGELAPLPPEEVQAALRNVLRVRRGQTLMDTLRDVRLSKDERLAVLGEQRIGVPEAELTDEEKAKLDERISQKTKEEFQDKLTKALGELKGILKEPEAEPVYVAGGKAYRLSGDGQLEVFQHEAAEPYAWKLGHDVRPARQSLGIGGCTDCHQAGAPIFEGLVTAVSPVLDEQPRTYAMYELAGYDKFKLDAWNQSFLGRTAFKWLGFASMGIVSLVLTWYAMCGLTGLAGIHRKA